MLVIKDCYT